MRVLLGVALATICYAGAAAQTDTFSSNSGGGDQFNANSGTGNPQGVGGDCRTGPLYSCPTGKQTNNPPRLPGTRNDRFATSDDGGDLRPETPIRPWWLDATDPLKKWKVVVASNPPMIKGGAQYTEKLPGAPGGGEQTPKLDPNGVKMIDRIEQYADDVCEWWWTLRNNINKHFYQHWKGQLEHTHRYRGWEVTWDGRGNWTRTTTEVDTTPDYPPAIASFVVTTQRGQKPQIKYSQSGRAEWYKIDDRTATPLAVTSGPFLHLSVKHAFALMNARPQGAPDGIPPLPPGLVRDFPNDGFVHGVHIVAHYGNTPVIVGEPEEVLANCLEYVRSTKSVDSDGRKRAFVAAKPLPQEKNSGGTNLDPR